MIPVDGSAVWWADAARYRQAFADVLDPVERGRGDAIQREADRVLFTLGAATLRLAAAAALDRRPEQIQVRRVCPQCGGPHGRPELPGTGLHASISHSGERVAVALSRVAPLGVDVEAIREVDLTTISAGVLGSGEQAADLREFFVYWTRKEAVMKATGDGMTVALRQVLVGPPAAPAELLSYPGRPGLPASIVDLDAGPGYAAALACLHPRRGRVVHRDAAELVHRVP